MAELRSTMQDFPLTLAALLRHACDVHPDSPVLTCRDGAMVDSASVAERFSFVSELPRTSVGKLDKKGRRARFGDGALAVVEVGRSAALPPAGSLCP